MKTFLQQVTDHLIEQYGLTALGQLTLVFPMQRAGLFVKQYLATLVQNASNDTPIVLPEFTTIDALNDSLCELHNEEEITSVCTLYEAYKHHAKRQLPIDAFYGWGVQLLNDFSAADMALVPMKSFMQFTAQAKEFEKTVLEPETRQRLEKLIHTQGEKDSIREYFTDLWAVLPAIYTDFQNAQLKDNVGTRGARYRWTIAHFNQAETQQRIQGRTYVFIGFNFLLHAERELMRLFHKQGQALFYWDYNPEFTLDASVYQFIRENISEFPNALPPATCNLKPEITAIACQSSAAQAQYVHEWLTKHHHPNEQTAIVIADESQLQSVIYALPKPEQLSSRINITKGYPLRSTLLYGKVSELMNNHLDDSTTALELLPLVAQELETFYRGLERFQEDSWQAVLLDESYYQIQLVVRQLQLLLLQNDFVRGELAEKKVLISLLRRKLEAVTIPFHGEPVTDIQIIGVLETRLLDFDHVLILNVEEDIVPSRSNDKSFLPYDLRREYGMATREEESRIYAYNFFRLFRRASDVTMLFSNSFTDTGKHTMSRFLMQMICSPDYTINRFRLQESTKTIPSAPLLHTCFGDNDDDQVPDHLSPSSISTYIECPREFYLTTIRHIDESDIEQVMLTTSIIGTLCHALVQHAYITICAKALDAQGKHLTHPVVIEDSMIQTYLNDTQAHQASLIWAYQEANKRFARTHPQAENTCPYILEEHMAENHAIIAMAHKVLKNDLQLTPFTLVWLEHSIETKIEGLNFKGTIDRLDIIGHGDQQYIRVLDYKTGGYSDDKVSFDFTNLFTDHTRKYALQTLIYSEMVNQKYPHDIPTNLPIRPQLFFVKAKTEASPILGICDEKKTAIDNYAILQKDFLTGFHALSQDILNNCQPGKEFIMQPDLDICGKSYCPFHLLCGREKKDF